MSKAAFLNQLTQKQGVEKLLDVVARLRHPTEGCPWDLKQTHRSLKPYMLEEAYEAVEAIDDAEAQARPELLKDELGDVLLQVALHAQLAQEAGQFDFSAVCDTIAEKLIRRHPHVFGDVQVDSDADVVTNWNAIKQAEKGQVKAPESILDGVAKSQPALSRALETSKRAVKVGFEWPSLDSLWECVMSEYTEFRSEVQTLVPEQAVSSEQFDRLETEMGDIFFASVNLARHFKIDPEVALTKATAKFTRRFQMMEHLVRERYGPDKALETLDFEAWDALWNEAKAKTSC